MTPLPKRRWSTRRQGKRRAAASPSVIAMSTCSNCGQTKPNHTVCPQCGFYRGKQIIAVKTKSLPKS